MPTKTCISGLDPAKGGTTVSHRQDVLTKKSEFALKATFFQFFSSL
jgi:hypothetical protein